MNFRTGNGVRCHELGVYLWVNIDGERALRGAASVAQNRTDSKLVWVSFVPSVCDFNLLLRIVGGAMNNGTNDIGRVPMSPFARARTFHHSHLGKMEIGK